MSLINYPAHRAAIEALYEGRCTVFRYVKRPGRISGTTSGQWQAEAGQKDLPCYLEVEQLKAVGDGDVAMAAQSVTLIIAPEVVISEGAHVEVTQHGVTALYKRAGKPAVLGSHQEIPLEVVERVKHGQR